MVEETSAHSLDNLSLGGRRQLQSMPPVQYAPSSGQGNRIVLQRRHHLSRVEFDPVAPS